MNYKLRLLESIKRIYLVFYISLLEKALDNIKIKDASEEEYEVKEILVDR